jgi:alkanesulfonate monooxygenase SsuD/methylene tetrahydromethanopterin reductase-like flavin-dependent oxidoreductase (luciferase family)
MARKQKTKKEVKKYVLIYEYQDEPILIGTKEQLLEQIKADADMGDLDEDRSLVIFELGKKVGVNVERNVTFTVNWPK